ncbi:40S ribosomal protein S10 [Sigmodon hispidus]
MMLMPKKNRIAIYELLFKEGVMFAKKDVHMPKHPELADKNVPNLHMMKAMQSLKSRGYRSCLPRCAAAVLKLAVLGPKVQRVSDLQDSQDGRQTETPTEGVLCHLVLTRKLRPGLALQLNSSLEEALVVDVVSHLSEFEDCFE